MGYQSPSKRPLQALACSVDGRKRLVKIVRVMETDGELLEALGTHRVIEAEQFRSHPADW